MRMRIDYRHMNRVTIGDRHPLPKLDFLFNQFKRKDRLKIRVSSIKISLEDVLKMVFRTCYGYYDFFVILFELTDAPAAFMSLMTGVFKPFLDFFVIFFIDYTLCIREVKKIMLIISVLFWLSLGSRNYTQNFPSMNFV